MARYHDIANELETRIRNGRYTDHLPAIGALGAEFRVSIGTVRAAEKLLADRGLIRIAQGERVQLIDAPPHNPTEAALAALEQAENALAAAKRAVQALQ